MKKYRAIRTNTIKDGRTFLEGTITELEPHLVNKHWELLDGPLPKKEDEDANNDKALSDMINAAKPIKTAAQALGGAKKKA